MAIFLDNTTAPAVQPGLLRTDGAPCRVLGKLIKEINLPPSILGTVPVPTPALTAETVEMLDAIPPELPAPLPSLVAPSLHRRHLNESQRAMAAAKLANMKEGHAASQRQPHEIIDEIDAVEISTASISQGEAADLLNVGKRSVERAADVQERAVPELAAAVDRGEVSVSAAAEADRAEEAEATTAQARHMRRALEVAIAHGIALLDALDAAGVDLEDEGEAEPWLGWIDGKPVLSDSHDDREAEDDDEPILGAPERHPSCYQFASCDATSSQEHWADGSARHDEAEAVNEDGGDILDEGEETLGWSANVGQLALGPTTADGDATALERHGRGFIRSGPDDAEDGGDAERDDEHGTEDGEDIGHFARDWRSVTRDIQRKREADHV